MSSHPLLKFVHHKWRDSGVHWRPFVATYYLTYACDFHCPYCANGEGIPYPEMPRLEVDGARALSIVERLRREADHLVITGGEPLQHPDAAQFIRGLGALRFASVTLTTNGYALDAFLPEVAANLSTLVVSLDTLDHRKADAWYGKGAGTLQRVLDNIEAAARQSGRKYEILISAVATPGNLDDLYAVYEYTQARDFRIAVAPELRGVQPQEKLLSSRAYRDFFQFLVTEKRKGGKIFGSLPYLEHLRDFTKFTCHPLTTLAVDPLGNVLYPCLEKGRGVGNVLDADLDTWRVHAEQTCGWSTECSHSCFSACALGLALCIERSGGEFLDVLAEPWRRARRLVRDL